MIKRIASGAILAAAVFAAGFGFGSARSTVHAQSGSRVFELRVYHTYDGKLDDLLKRFREHTTGIFEKHGMTNIGYWVPQDDPLKGKTLYYLLAFPSRDAAKASWAAFRDDPEWKKVQTASEVNGKIVEKVDSTFLDPTDFSLIK